MTKECKKEIKIAFFFSNARHFKILFSKKGKSYIFQKKITKLLKKKKKKKNPKPPKKTTKTKQNKTKQNKTKQNKNKTKQKQKQKTEFCMWQLHFP